MRRERDQGRTPALFLDRDGVVNEDLGRRCLGGAEPCRGDGSALLAVRQIASGRAALRLRRLIALAVAALAVAALAVAAVAMPAAMTLAALLMPPALLL